MLYVGFPDHPRTARGWTESPGTLPPCSQVALFFLAFFPQFVHQGRGAAWSQLLVLGVTFCLVGLASDALYAIASGTVRRRISGRRRLGAAGDRLSALLYAALGGWAIWSGARAHAR